MMLVLEGLLLVLGLSLVVLPLTRGPMGWWVTARAGTTTGEERRHAALAGLAELEMDYRAGKLSKADYGLMKDDLLARAAQATGAHGFQAQRGEELRATLEAEVAEAVRRRLGDR